MSVNRYVWLQEAHRRADAAEVARRRHPAHARPCAVCKALDATLRRAKAELFEAEASYAEAWAKS